MRRTVWNRNGSYVAHELFRNAKIENRDKMQDDGNGNQKIGGHGKNKNGMVMEQWVSMKGKYKGVKAWKEENKESLM